MSHGLITSSPMERLQPVVDERHDDVNVLESVHSLNLLDSDILGDMAPVMPYGLRYWRRIARIVAT